MLIYAFIFIRILNHIFHQSILVGVTRQYHFIFRELGNMAHPSYRAHTQPTSNLRAFVLLSRSIPRGRALSHNIGQKVSVASLCGGRGCAPWRARSRTRCDTVDDRSPIPHGMVKALPLTKQPQQVQKTKIRQNATCILMFWNPFTYF